MCRYETVHGRMTYELKIKEENHEVKTLERQVDTIAIYCVQVEWSLQRWMEDAQTKYLWQDCVKKAHETRDSELQAKELRILFHKKRYVKCCLLIT